MGGKQDAIDIRGFVARSSPGARRFCRRRHVTLFNNPGEATIFEDRRGSEPTGKFDGAPADTDGGFRLEGGTKARHGTGGPLDLRRIVHHVEIAHGGRALTSEVLGRTGQPLGRSGDSRPTRHASRCKARLEISAA
jgi:hypothetical protein